MKIFIAGGGSGGHIYPALSIAKAIKELNPNCQIEFVGTDKGLETKIIPREGQTLHLIQSGKLNFKGQLSEKIKSLIKIPIGIFQSFSLILKYKPDFVLGVGGYASAPMTLAASLLRIKTAIWEPNAHPGLANRILSRFVKKSYLVFEDAKAYLKTKQNLNFGMPLRYKPASIIHRVQTNHPFTILCFGGSQGSMFLNDKISDLILQNPELENQIFVIHQTGPKDFLRMKEKYKNVSNVEVHDYIFDMPKYYVQSNLLFCRGGASTLAEAALFGVVPVVVPLPAADNHQQRNAESLVSRQAGLMFLQDQFKADEFSTLIRNLINDPVLLAKMTENLKRTVPEGAAEKIAADILSQIS